MADKLIKLSDYIARRLAARHGVKDVFMISGGGAMHLNDSLGRVFNYYTAHNEQALAIEAEGYARLKQTLAVVNVTTGPGGLNALNGVFGQWTDSAPVLYISGQVKEQTTIHACPHIPLRQLGDQEADIISIVKPLTKYAVSVTDPHSIKYHLDKAVYLAAHGRPGPVWIDVPMNIQAALINPNKLKSYNPGEDVLRLPPYKKQLAAVITKLKAAKRPVIVAGHGIRIAGAETIFKKLLTKLNIPVVTTFNGVDLLEDSHKNYIGRIGTIGQRAGNFALQNADFALFLGTRNNIRQVSYNWESFAKNAFTVSVDIDKAELCKPTFCPGVKINADLKDFLPALLRAAPALSRPEWTGFCKKLKNKYSFYKTADYKYSGKKISPYHFVRELSELTPAPTPVVAGNGSACVVYFQTGEIKKNQRVFWNSGDASMGYDLPAAIGTCIAGGRKNTLCLAGDGSLMMNLQELQTLKHYNLPVKIFVLNNNGYVSIKQTQQNFFNGRRTAACPQSGVSVPDFTAVARSFGIEAVTLKKQKDAPAVIKKALSAKGPVLVNVMLEEDYIFVPKLSSRRLPDGSMQSPELENMFPFLDRAEFEKNIIRTKLIKDKK